MNWKEFKREMQKAGWRLSSTQGYFEHKETLKHFNPFNSVNVNGRMIEAWQEYASDDSLPPKFEILYKRS